MTIKLNAATGGGSVSLSAPNSTTSNLDVELTLPVDDGAANTFLKSDGSGTLSWASASSDSITEGNTTVECVDTGSDGHITFDTEGSEAARFDSGGRLLINGTTSQTWSGGQCFLQVNGTSASGNVHLGAFQYSNSADGGELVLGSSRGTTVGANTVVQNGDTLGRIRFCAADGTDFTNRGGEISCRVDGTPGSDDIPTRMMFFTALDGAGSPTERLRLTAVGEFRQFTSSGGGAVGFASGNGSSSNPAIVFSHSASGIGGGTDSFRVAFNGNVVNTNNSYGSISDVKLKENIVDAGSQWDDIKGIQVRKYNFKAETNQQTHTQLGVIAQEVELVSPGLVTESPDKENVQVPVLDSDGNVVLDENGDQVFTTETRDLGTVTKSVNYSVLYMKSVKALQEAMTRIETLETANASLEARLTALEGGAS